VKVIVDNCRFCISGRSRLALVDSLFFGQIIFTGGYLYLSGNFVLDSFFGRTNAVDSMAGELGGFSLCSCTLPATTLESPGLPTVNPTSSSSGEQEVALIYEVQYTYGKERH